MSISGQSSRAFTNLSEAAPWRASERMPFETYLGRLEEPRHPLVRSVFFCHRTFFYLDVMHLCECKGLSGLTYGGALSHLMTDLRLGANQETRLQTINAHLQAYQRAHPSEGNN